MQGRTKELSDQTSTTARGGGGAPPLLLGPISHQLSCCIMPTAATVASAEKVVVCVPLTPHQEQILPATHRQYSVQHLVKVTLTSGTVGWGEGSQYSGLVTQEALDAAVGELPAAMMYNDSIGVPLQMALFDAVGRELGCPVHALLPGGKQRDWVPLSWWCHSSAPADWADEAKYALENGYTTCKYKARPWWCECPAFG
jgi:L-alanine-DL-glutamate epimerase-like enolase superfamily enzyme